MLSLSKTIGNNPRQTKKKYTIMTNAESKLQDAIEKRDGGQLNDWESDFVSQFEGWDKKRLRKLTYKQYCKLRDIADS